MSERLKAKAEQNARAGKVVNGGRRRYGYTPDRSALVEDEADVIRDVARRLIAGDSLSGLVKRLNGQGARTSYGALWSAKKLRTVMQHDALCGRVVFRGERLHGVKGEWPTILTEEEFDRVQVALQARRRIHDHWTVDRVHLLSGLARCGIDGCDGKMIGYKQTSGVLTYTCSVRKHLSRDMRRLDEFVLSEVKARAADTYFPVPEWVDEDQSRIRQEIADLQERKASSVRDLVEKRITSETLGAVVAEFDARISNLEARQVDAVVNRQVESIVFDLDRIEALPVNDQRAAVELFVERLIVHPVKKRGRGFDPTAVELVWRDLARLQWHAVVEK